MSNIPSRDASGNIIVVNHPFKSKIVENGKLFRRKHGFDFTSAIAAGQNDSLELVAPYSSQKINLLELTNCNEGDAVDLIVLDSATGIYQQLVLGIPAESVTPKLQLNQFGFGCKLPAGFYRDKSEYDADMIGGMIVKVVYYNNSGSSFTPSGNIIWHEVVSS